MNKLYSIFSLRLFQFVFSTFCALLLHNIGYAQWTPSAPAVSDNIYTTNTAGNVGIGVATGGLLYQKLHVNGNIHIPIGNSLGWNQSGDKFVFNGRDIGHYSLGWYAENGGAAANLSGAGGIRFFTNALERMFINAGGNVGIGTTSPLGRLDINPGGWNNIPKISFNQYGDNPSIRLYRPTGAVVGGNLTSFAWLIETDGTGSMAFKSGPHAVSGTETVATKILFDINGNVGIGTTDTKGYKLGVNGAVVATAVTVKLHGNWPDFVFAKTHRLRPLSEVESYIQANQHLPEVPSAAEVAEEGINLGKMDATLLRKIEELTLYMIEMKKENEAQSKQIQELKKENAQIKSELAKQK